LRQAILHYDTGAFRRSIRVLLTIQRVAQERTLSSQVQLYLGLNYGVLGEKERARVAFTEALRLLPSLTLDPKQTKESLLVLFNEVRGILRGKVSVKCDRAPCGVVVDGIQVGAAPRELELSVGYHQVELMTADRLWGYRGRVLVSPGATVTLNAALTFLGGRLRVESEPAGAEVTIDGVVRGQTPTTEFLLSTGKHRLMIKRSGFEPVDRELHLVGGERRKLSLGLVPVPAPKEVVARQPVQGAEVQPRKRVWTWVALASAGAAAGLGIGFGVAARNSFDHYKAAAAAGDATGYSVYRDRTEKQQKVASGALISAGILAATAVVLFFVEGRRTANAEPRGRVGRRDALGSGTVGVEF
jgi:hypothetical protein